MTAQLPDPSTLVLELPHKEGNPRNSEGSFITLNDGRIMFAYTHFNGDHWGDHATADIVARYSSDQGLTWTKEDELIVANKAGCNIMSVSFLRLQNGALHRYYLVKESLMDCRLHVQTSDDEGVTWSEPVCCIPAPGYFIVNNDRVVQLQSGRIVVPACFHRTKRFDKDPQASQHDSTGIAIFFYSDDNGAAWQEADQWLALPRRSTTGLQEPGVIELEDGSLLAWARTDTGHQWEMRSEDGGLTWTQPQESSFVSPRAPLSMKRIPSTGDLLAVWNDVFQSEHENRYNMGRTPLSSAISKDEGKTWSKSRSIETDPERGYCYTAIHFVDDAVLLAYCSGGGTSHALQDLSVRKIPLEWFYQD